MTADTDLLVSQSQLGHEFLPVLSSGGELGAVTVGDEPARGGLGVLQPGLMWDRVSHLVQVHLDRRESRRGKSRKVWTSSRVKIMKPTSPLSWLSLASTSRMPGIPSTLNSAQGCRVQSRVQSSRFRVQGAWFSVQDTERRAQSALPGHEPNCPPAPLAIVDLLVLLLGPAGLVALLDGLLKVALQQRREIAVLGPGRRSGNEC